jgi:hypothetical protein
MNVGVSPQSPKIHTPNTVDQAACGRFVAAPFLAGKGPMAAVKSRYLLDKLNKSREKIANSEVLDRVIQTAEGKIKLTSTELRACEILLRKIIPDLSAMTLSGEDGDAIKTVTKIELVPAGTIQAEKDKAETVDFLD